MTTPRQTVRGALDEARQLGVPALDSQRLLAQLLGITRTAVIAHGEFALGGEALIRWSEWLERRSRGEPLAYLLGEKEFRGLRFQVTPDVLVPRPETELLVDWVVELGSRRDAGASSRLSIVDLGTGSGAIAVAVALALPQADLTAVDISVAALRVARRNAESLGAAVCNVESSWWRALGSMRFDLAVSNPPYIADNNAALTALEYEPRDALVSGSDGLVALREVIGGAPAHLRPGGWLIVEHGSDQGAAVRDLFASAGFAQVATRADLAGLDRATGGRISRLPK